MDSWYSPELDRWFAVEWTYRFVEGPLRIEKRPGNGEVRYVDPVAIEDCYMPKWCVMRYADEVLDDMRRQVYLRTRVMHLRELLDKADEEARCLMG